MTQRPDNTGVALFLTMLVIGTFLVVVAGVGAEPAAFPSDAGPRVGPPVRSAQPTSEPTPGESPTFEPKPEAQALPHGSKRIFDGRMLVAYYGTATTGVLGVLGETSPDRASRSEIGADTDGVLAGGGPPRPGARPWRFRRPCWGFPALFWKKA